jgi:tRNA A37 threonylcarbamoyladenosine biosynthesis protein TsaE
MTSSPHTNDGTTMDLVHTQRQVDIRQIVERTNTQAQTDLALVGVSELGETGGAAFVEWPDGRHSVVTTATVSVIAMHQTAEVAAGAGRRVTRAASRTDR